MTDIYLSQVTLSDFRTFGQFDVQIPAGPGLTLLVGTNGLGKSSFFDAIEWGLTGQVRRLLRYLPARADEATYLRRRGAAGPHGVTLQFSDGKRVHRQGGAKPVAGEVIELLKKPEWDAGIEDIGTYLAFTHFLGQAEPQRFTSRDSGEQWKALKGPSGIDRLEDIRRGLRGRSTSMAFTRRIDRDAEAVETAEKEVVVWKDFQARLAVARDASGAAGGIDPEALRSQLQSLDERLNDLIGSSASPASDETTAGVLTRQRGLVQAERISIQQAIRRLDDLSTVPQRYAAQVAAASPDAPEMRSGRERLETAKTVRATSSLTSEGAQFTAATAGQDLAAKRDALAAIAGVGANRRVFAATQAEIQRSSAARESVRSDLAKATPELASVQTLLAGTRQRAEAVSALAARLATASDLSTKARLLPELTDKTQKASEELAALISLAQSARAALPQLVEQRDRSTADRNAARARLEGVRARSTAMAAAVAQIAAHLHETDAACPVCRTNVGAGELLRVAKASAATQSEDLAAAEALEARLSADLVSINGEIAANELSIRNANLADSALRFAEEALQAQRSVVQAGLPEPSDDLLAAAEKQQQDATDAFNAALQASSGDAAATADASARLATLTTEISNLEQRLAELDAAVAVGEARLEVLRQALAAAGHEQTPDADFQALIGEAEAAHARGAATAKTADEAAAAALQAYTAATAEVQSAQQALDAAETTRAAAQAAAAVLQGNWKREGLRGTPDAAELERAYDAQKRRSDALERLEDERSQLVAAFDLTLSQKSLQDLIAEMVGIGGPGAADDPRVYEQRLEKKVEEAQTALARSRTVNAVVRRFSETLREKAESFSRDFLAPLNDLIGAYNEALLSNPGDSIRFKADNRIDRTDFGMGLSFRERWEDNLFDKSLPPQVVLSEGQMAANGFSILCAASTAYPWSRWRALMLDDPLQHNDIIHAAAFVDLMRNLVQMQDYQLVMSSHDRAEAEFIARKFDAAGLPCKIINLTAPSRAGVRYDEPTPNLAAQQLLQLVELSA